MARGEIARAVVLGLSLATAGSAQGDSIVVAGKNFTESGVLAELMAQTLEAHTTLRVERRLNLGGTMICWQALLNGEIDVYADYTGTGWAIVLKEPGRIQDPLQAYFHVRQRYHDEYQVAWLTPFGLDNSYALAMSDAKARELGVHRISDLLPYQERLRAGFSVEFANREDGYPGLATAYSLHLGRVRTIEHGLAYQALAAGEIDLVDAYTTDGKLLRYQLRVLRDDRGFFPPYHAAPLVRESTLRAHPEIERALALLSFRIANRSAQALNYVAETEAQTAAQVARAFLEREGLVDGAHADAAVARAALERALTETPTGDEAVPTPDVLQRLRNRGARLPHLLLQHLGLTSLAVLLAALVAVPLGIAISSRPRLRRACLAVASMVQTIPSLALLAFMIPLLGLDVKAAIAALFLYALLPILRNTYTGITEVDPGLVDAARGLGLRPRQVLTSVQLPLALRTIMAGVRTATVISIGVATLAAFIGAGGLGEPIVEGLYLNDSGLILLGAVPAAALALLADLVVGRLEGALQPRTRSA